MKLHKMKLPKELLNKQFYILLGIGVALFVIFFILGVLTYQYFEEFILMISDWLQDISTGKGVLSIFSLIFFQNFRVALIIFASGFTIIIPSFILISNGLIAGMVTAYHAKSIVDFLWLLPHGVFELASFFIAYALGIHLILNWKKKRIDFVKRYVYYFLIMVVPLLLLAAIIETTLFFLY